MKTTEMRELQLRFASQHGLVSREQLRLLGVSSAVEAERVRRGEWQRAGAKVVRLAGSPRTPAQRLMAACLEIGPSAVASHQSAAWLWGLLPEPRRHAVTVARQVWFARPAGVDVHRLSDLPARGALRQGIACTDPVRTVIDLAAVCTTDALDAAVDGGLAAKVFTVVALEREMDRLARKGRRGVGALRRALRRRGFIGAPYPSVLESRVLRLLHQHGIEPVGVEVRLGEGGRYRVDTLLDPSVVMEVDGYAYHSSPEQKAEDERRRGRLRLDGFFVLVYTWLDVTRDGGRVVHEAHRALAAHGTGASRTRAGSGGRGRARVADWSI